MGRDVEPRNVRFQGRSTALSVRFTLAHAAFQEPRQRLHDSFSRAPTPHLYVDIIGVTTETVASALEFFVEVIQQDVRQPR